MNAALTLDKPTLDARVRALGIVFAATALALGIWSARGSSQWVDATGFVLVPAVVALTMPLGWVVLALVVLIPLQIYFPLPDSTLTLRLAVVFVALVAVRLAGTLVPGPLRPDTRGQPQSPTIHRVVQFWRERLRLNPWWVPAGVFLAAAFLAGLGAESRYLAFRGIFDWAIVFLTAWVVSTAVRTLPVRDRFIVCLAGAGVFEALIGLVEYILGLDRVLYLLTWASSGFIFQPNLLAERLTDLSFNWIVADRLVPFGTFINAIDYAVFLATTLSLTLALLVAKPSRVRQVILLMGTVVIGLALVLTLKGSGLIAIAGGAATVLFLSAVGARRAGVGRPALWALGLTFIFAVIAVPFWDTLAQRVSYLVQRELGTSGDTGRLEIWTSLLPYVAQRPFFGFGLNNAPFITEPMRTLRQGIVAFNATSPESAYVATLVETGVLGFMGLAGLFWLTLVRAYQNVRADNNPAMEIGLIAALVALLLGNLTVVGFTTDQNGMLLGALIGLVFGKCNPQ